MKILAVNLIFASVLGLYRGFFQGMGTMVPTALSRFLEEVLCLIVMLVAAGKMGEYGSKVGALLQNPNYEQAFGRRRRYPWPCYRKPGTPTVSPGGIFHVPKQLP